MVSLPLFLLVRIAPGRCIMRPSGDHEALTSDDLAKPAVGGNGQLHLRKPFRENLPTRFPSALRLSRLEKFKSNPGNVDWPFSCDCNLTPPFLLPTNLHQHQHLLQYIAAMTDPTQPSITLASTDGPLTIPNVTSRSTNKPQTSPKSSP